ncbi:LOW QUALITY PROTEIN: hypothetical protein HJC23_009598 [Cyclotella cryptica]|uniref:Silicon transporter n=1 Tax=Cyclotella cryptica TaxID=29204 RepID=A0ABD3PSB5_9STRA
MTTMPTKMGMISLTPFTLLRYTLSVALLAFSIAIVVALIFTGNTRVARDANPWVALIVTAIAIIWLSMIEGEQASLVGLPPVDPDLYKDSHPITYKVAALAFRGDNLDRYLMGRQFMVLLVVFVIGQCTSPLDPTVDVLGLPSGVKFVFLDIGLATIVFTCVLGQLTTQVNASHCMIDFANNYFALFTLYVAMTIEFTGVMHSAYLIQNILAAVSGKPIQSNEPPKTGFTFAFFWGRVIMSLAILGFCVTVVLYALLNGYTMSEEAEFWQEDLRSLVQREWTELARLHDWSAINCRLFLLFGWVFHFATIVPGEGNNIFGVSDGAQAFLNYGFQGAVMTTILASITWQYAASAFPIAFMNSPVTHVLLLVALGLEFTGICAGAWVLALIQKKVMGFQYDEVYVPEERLANNHPDKEFGDDVGHLTGGGFMGHAVGSHDALDGPITSKDAIDA